MNFAEGWYAACCRSATGLVVRSVCLGEELPGKVLFATQCARCHGEEGTGTEDYPDALRGDLSALQLAEVIRLTMPEDDPETLSVEEGRQLLNTFTSRSIRRWPWPGISLLGLSWLGLLSSNIGVRWRT